MLHTANGRTVSLIISTDLHDGPWSGNTPVLKAIKLLNEALLTAVIGGTACIARIISQAIFCYINNELFAQDHIYKIWENFFGVCLILG